MTKIMFGIAFGLLCSGVNASEIDNVKITRTMMDSNYGLKLFIQVGGTPARESDHCHSNRVWDYAISTEGELGKQMLSQLLSAYVSQKPLKLFGSDTCNVNSSTEDLRRIELL